MARVVKLSVIVPFYNVLAYAPDTLRSLRANAREDIEFILVDDCSTDGTGELLRRAQDGVEGAVLLVHEENRGLATARNTGLDAARGEYIAFLDGDDWLVPGHYARLLTETERLGCSFVRTDHVRVTGRTRTVRRVPHGPRGVVSAPRDAILPAHRTTSVDYAFAWAGLYHRELLDRGLLHFTDGLRTAEDRPWIWRLHREAESFAVLGTLGHFYRRGSPPPSHRSVTCASSTSCARSTRSSRRPRRTATRRPCCRRRYAPTAPCWPTIWATSASSNRRWPVR